MLDDRERFLKRSCIYLFMVERRNTAYTRNLSSKDHCTQDIEGMQWNNKKGTVVRSLRKQFSIHVPCPVSTSRIVHRACAYVYACGANVTFVLKLNASRLYFLSLVFLFSTKKNFLRMIREEWYWNHNSYVYYYLKIN